MKLKRQFLQLTGTGFLLLSVLLALGLTAPSELKPVDRNSKTIRKESGTRGEPDHAISANRHEDAASAWSGSFEGTASGISREMTHGKLLNHYREPEPSISETNHDISFSDPMVARFKELGSMRLQTLDAQLPGHSLPAFGRRAFVEEVQQVSGTTGTMLTLAIDSITPEPDADPSLSENDDIIKNPSHPSTPGRATVSEASNPWNRLSYEQELFRTKWGWQAFDQVQKVLREQRSQ